MPKVEHGINEATGLSGLESAKKLKRTAIDAETSAAIFAGFDYEVDGTLLHFSYDAFDQQNFADTANAALVSSSAGQAFSIVWNAYRADGALQRLTLNATAFLTMYTQGALMHKATCMERGGARKALLELAETPADLENI